MKPLISQIIIEDITIKEIKKLDEKQVNRLADVVKRLEGLPTPIVVKRLDVDKYELVSGQLQFEASKKAGFEMIQAFIVGNNNRISEMYDDLDENVLQEFFEVLEPKEVKPLTQNNDITTKSGRPFKTESSAKAGRTRLLKKRDGKFNIVKLGDFQYVLREVSK